MHFYFAKGSVFWSFEDDIGHGCSTLPELPQIALKSNFVSCILIKFFILSIIASGDGRIRIWEDVSEKKREEEERKQADKVRNEQILSNLMEQKRYGEALAFSLTLSRPYRCVI